VVELDAEYERTAVRAAQIMGLRVAGVDMLESKSGPQIMEVNSSPGLEGIEGATQLDIAGAIVDYIAQQVDFPELDVRQRLTVTQGYGVAELTIPEGYELVGRTISESGLRDKDIAVLTLHRGTSVISNPRGARVIEAGDRLLCYGRLEEMRHLVGERKKRKRRPKVRPLPEDSVGGAGSGEDDG
jgi:ribosomal protein S6--L-glutamate ligase